MFHTTLKIVPVTQVIPGREAEMAENLAGGVAFKVDDIVALRRWLLTGSENNLFYLEFRQAIPNTEYNEDVFEIYQESFYHLNNLQQYYILQLLNHNIRNNICFFMIQWINYSFLSLHYTHPNYYLIFVYNYFLLIFIN